MLSECVFFRCSNEDDGIASDVVLRRRAGWFLQSVAASTHRRERSMYDISIVPLFLDRVLNVQMTSTEWHDVVDAALAHLAPELHLLRTGGSSISDTDTCF